MQFRRLNTLTAVRCTAGFRFLAKVRFSRNCGSCPLAKLLFLLSSAKREAPDVISHYTTFFFNHTICILQTPFINFIYFQ